LARKEEKKNRPLWCYDALIGTPSHIDTRNLNQATTDFIHDHCTIPVHPTDAESDLATKARFRAKFAGATDEALSLLIELLRFSPDRRISVDDALAHPFLALAKEQEEGRMAFVCAKPLNGEIEAIAENKQNLLKEVKGNGTPICTNLQHLKLTHTRFKRIRWSRRFSFTDSEINERPLLDAFQS
jgi:serine/threonine protein kinase